MRRAPLLGLTLLAPLLAAGCGRGSETPLEASEGEAPVWSLARGERTTDGESADFQARSACRLRLLVLEGDAAPRSASERVLAAGESVRLAWKGEGTRASKPISLEDERAGRTEAWMAVLGFTFEGDAPRTSSPVVGTRPGRGHALAAYHALPPVTPQPLAFDQEVELCVAGIADGGPLDLALVSTPTGARLRGALDAAQGDRVVLLRLRLRAERLER